METKKIVLTGGPGAGKSTIIEYLEKYLNQNNIPNHVISETVSDLNREIGIKPSSTNSRTFQNMVYYLQKVKEEGAINGFKHRNEDKLIICDRGLVDNRAYLTDDTFNELLNQYNDNFLDISNQYDYVIALSSAANLDNGYTLENNPARYESKEEAIEKNKRTIESWILTRNLKIIPAQENFENKKISTLNYFRRILNDYMIKEHFRYIPNNSEIVELKKEREIFEININQKYLSYKGSSLKKYIEDIEYDNNHVYYFVKKLINGYEEEIICDKRITEKEYDYYLQNEHFEYEVNIKEERFIKDNYLYKLQDLKYFNIIEIENINDEYINKYLSNKSRIDNYEYDHYLNNYVSNKDIKRVRKV